ALVADRPRGVLDPDGGPVRPLELDVELADDAFRLDPLQPDGPAGRVDVHRFDGDIAFSISSSESKPSTSASAGLPAMSCPLDVVRYNGTGIRRKKSPR